MGIKILMPALSPTMEEGRLARWLVKEGDQVLAGDILAEIETDKATMEFEAVDEGLVEKILIAEGTEGVAVNTPIAILAGEDSSLPAEKKPEVAVSPSGGGSVTSSPAAPVAPPVVPPVEPEMPLSKDVPTKEMSVRDALCEAMAEEMRRDDTVFLMGEEVGQYQGAYKVSRGLVEEFGEKRVIDTPITEHGFTGIGVGAAFGGLKPIVEFMTFNFAMQALDQIVNSAAKTLYMSGGQLGASIVFRGPNGAAARVGAQHSQDYSAWYAHIPGLKVAVPFSADDAKGLLKTAIRDPNPVIFLENEILYGQNFSIPEVEDYTVPFGKARLWRSGSDVTLVSFGIGMNHSLAAAEQLAALGISAEVIDLRTLRPLDTQTVLESVRKTNRCVTVEEGFPVASIGNYISAVLMQEAFDYLDAPVINCTGKDVPMPYAANLEKLALITVDEIVSAVKSVCYYKDKS